MADLTFTGAKAQRELVTGTPGANQEQITGAETVGATSASNQDSGWTFNTLKAWIQLDASYMDKATYDSSGDGVVNSAVQLKDGADTVTGAQARAHIDDATIHYVINDAGTAVNQAWSSSKIFNELGGKEGALGNPTTSGDILSSTIGGVRSWVPDKIGPPGGTEGQISVKNSATENDWIVADVPIAFPVSYTYDNNTTKADPGAGKMRMDSAAISTTTNFYVSNTTLGGLPLNEFPEINQGTLFKVYQANDNRRAGIFEVQADPVSEDGGAWWTVAVQNKAVGQTDSFRDNKEVVFEFFGIGAGGVEEAPSDNRSYFRQDEAWTTSLRGYGEVLDARGNSSGGITYNADSYNRITATINGGITSLTLTTTMVAASILANWTVATTAGHVLTSVNWGTAGVPPMTNGKRYRIAFFTEDTGSSWDGVWNEY